jgi:pSer/pThr/pTyr-binding forkhead associated (FHA) protein
MHFSLVMKLTDGTERRFPLRESRTLIGRETRCHVRIALPNIAERHCEIILDNGELQLSDLGSELGTLVNGSPVKKAVLSPADELTVGPVTFHVLRDQPQADNRDATEIDEDQVSRHPVAQAELEINVRAVDSRKAKSQREP